MDEGYLLALRNTHTDTITADIPTIMAHLIKTYGRMTPLQLKEKQRAVKDMSYDPTEPVNTIFNAIKKFQDLAQLMGKGKTDTQLIDMAYLIFQRTGHFKDSLMRWNKLSEPPAKTYELFKDHMRDEHADLEQVEGLTQDTSSLNTNLLKAIKENQDNMETRLQQQMKANFMEALGMFAEMENKENIPPCPPAPAANKMPTTKDRLLKLFKKMEAKFDAKLEKLGSQRNNSTTGGSRDKTINPRTGKSWKRYCWTHGLVSYFGKDCKNKAPGHRDDASFKNHMGGSTKGVLGV